MRINPYLSFNGGCAEAFRFYEKVLGGSIEAMMTYGEAPACEGMSADWNDKIMHARLVVGDQILMGSDSPPQFREETGGFHVSLQIEEPAEAERIFHALAENGRETMPIGETFWAIRFGMLVDQFGIPWMVNCDRPA